MFKKIFYKFNSLSIRLRFLLTFFIIISFLSVSVAGILYIGVNDFLSHEHISKILTDEDKEIVYITRNRLLIVGSFFVVLSIFLSFTASNYFSGQIKRILNLLKSYSEGKLDSRELNITGDEVGDIILNLHRMADIVNEKQQNLIDAQQRLGDLYNHSPIMLCTLDLDGYIFNVNKTLEDFLLIKREDIVGTSFLDLISKDTHYVFGGDFKKFILHYKSTRDIVIKMIKSTGEVIDVSMAWNFFYINWGERFSTHDTYKGEEVYGLRVILKDISAEKEAERQKNVLFETMNVVPRLLGTNIASEEVLEYILEELKKVVDFNLASILLSPTEELESYIVAAVFGQNINADELVGKVFYPDHAHLDVVISYQESHVINSLFYKDIISHTLDGKSLITPLLFLKQVFGFLILERHNETQPFEHSQIAMCEAFSSVAAGAMQNLILREEVQGRTIEVKRAFEELEKKDMMIQRELDMALSIQQGILPQDHYNWNGIKILNFYHPMREIGGDFYDNFHLPQGDLAILIADVSGHGIPAALVTAMAKSSFVSAAQKYFSPKKILLEVNQELVENIKTDDYLSVFLLIIDKNYRITYVNAGHQEALLHRKKTNNIERLTTPGYFCGIMGEMGESYQEESVKLEYGDRIFLFTDGLVEATNSKKEQFGLERIENIFTDNPQASINELQEYIKNNYNVYTKGVKQQDDISFIIIELDQKYERIVQAVFEGRKNFKLGNFKESIFFFEKALKGDPDNLDILLILGEAFFRNYQFEESIKNFEKYLCIKNTNPHVHYHLALSYFKLKEYDQAIKCCNNVLNIDKNFIKALHLIGLIKKILNEFEEARSYFTEVLKTDPDNLKAKNEIQYLDSLITG